MIRNYFKIAWRNLVRNKVYSFINIGGLAVGMAVVILISLWVYDEITFNRTHKNYERIAQLRRYYTDPDTRETNGADGMHYPMVPILRNEYKAWFKNVLMAWWPNEYSVSTPDKKIARMGEFMDPAGLEMLSIKMLKGNYHSLNDLQSVVLSKSTAQAFFGNEDPINKRLKIDNRLDVTVTGVYEDIAKNSRFGEIQFFAPWELWKNSLGWMKQAE